MSSVLLVPTISMVGTFIIQADGFLLCCRQDQEKNFAPSGSRKDSVFATTSIRRWKKADENSNAGFNTLEIENAQFGNDDGFEFKRMIDQSNSVIK